MLIQQAWRVPIVEPEKVDSEKPKMYLLPPKATVEVAKVLTLVQQV